MEAPAIAQNEALTEEDMIAEADMRASRRGATLGKLFDGLKNKFMSLFEEVEDKEME
jgi:hypothetical protein